MDDPQEEFSMFILKLLSRSKLLVLISLCLSVTSTLGQTNCTPSTIIPYLQINGGSWSQGTSASVTVGNSVKFGPQPKTSGSWSWSGPNNFSATTREISINNIQTTQAGTYIATYTNKCGAKTTQNFTVIVANPCTPSTITPYVQINGGSWNQGASASLTVGNSLTFGPSPTSGIWSWSGPDNFSATTREISLSNVQTTQAGTYIATYTNDCGAKTTQKFTVTVENPCTPSTITPSVQINGGSWNQTASASATVGNSLVFSPSSSSTNGAWSWSGPNNFSATTREISLSNIQTTQAGTYIATYTNDCGTKTTQNFTITVANPCTPSTVTPYVQINGGSWNQGASASLTVGNSLVFGPSPTNGTWSWSGPNNFSATTREISLTNVQTTQAGTYIATFTNDCGAKTTQNFTVTVANPCSPSTITPYVQINGGSWSQGASASVNVSNSLIFGPQPINGTWGWSGPNGFTSTAREISFSNIQTAQAGTYIATYTNACGAKTTQNFTVSVAGGDNQTPSIPGTPVASNVTGNSCALAWTASTDNVAVTGYKVLTNGTTFMTVTGTTANITGLSASTTYSFTVVAYDATGNSSAASGAVSVTTSSNPGSPYNWPSYNPTISYNFANEYGNVATPTKVLDDCSGIVGTQSSDWWCFRWGANKNSLVTSAAITPLLARLNTDFAYFRDVMGWPPDSRVLNGYRSAAYLYGSGLCTDNASNTALGGWMTSVWYNGQYWPIILASYYPIYSFDPACTYSDKAYQQSAMVHEGIHCLLASLPGCKDAGWFHEGGNTWLQQEADSRRSGNYGSMGFLNAAAMVAPFMPIECYSGWLQDGSFGGPSAEGVNMYNGTQQICTWKNLLGGNQYGNLFPTFLGQVLGDGAIPWIWKYATSRVLQGMSTALGDAQTRRLICEFRAKQALVDFGVWTNAVTALLDNYMGTAIKEEWSPYNIQCNPWTATPYVATTNSNGTLTPASWTTPGWSGANQIPLTVSGNSITVNFQPIGANMTCQLCYIATDGSRVYSQIISSGNCTLTLTKAPANNVVIAVICNTDYVYNGEVTRKAHYDYRLQLGAGVTGTANINSKWYKGANALRKTTVSLSDGPLFDISQYCSHGYNAMILKGNNEPYQMKIDTRVSTSIIRMKNGVSIDVPSSMTGALVELTNLLGKILYRTKIDMGGKLFIKNNSISSQGVYVITVKTPDGKKTYLSFTNADR
jgi:hypothetical protein